MRFLDYYFPILSTTEQYILFFVIISLYIIYINFFQKKEKWILEKIFIFLSFVYIFFLINLSFFPFHSVRWNLLDYINLIPFSTFTDDKRYILSFLIIFPAWFLISYFSKKNWKNIIFWFFLAIIIELLQLLILYISLKNNFWSNRPFTVDDIIIRIFWFLFWIILYKIFEKLFIIYRQKKEKIF